MVWLIKVEKENLNGSLSETFLQEKIRRPLLRRNSKGYLQESWKWPQNLRRDRGGFLEDISRTKFFQILKREKRELVLASSMHHAGHPRWYIARVDERVILVLQRATYHSPLIENRLNNFPDKYFANACSNKYPTN